MKSETFELTVLNAEEGKKIVNKKWLDYKANGGEMPELLVCSQVYLAVNDSAENYEEITEAEAEAYQREWDEAHPMEAPEVGVTDN